MPITNSDLTSSKGINYKVSVVVAFRNEEKNLPKLINELSAQSFFNLEFILNNDHSEDNSLEIAKKQTENDKRFKITSLPSNEYGKKNAIQNGNSLVTGDYVLYTDADCSVQPSWVEKTVLYMINNQLDFCSGTVCVSNTKSLIEKLQAVEFSQLVGIGHFLIYFKMPVICNGANMAINKKLVGAPLKSNISSGDDVFLLHYACKNKMRIGYITDIETKVTTSAMPTFSTWLSQRIRWAGKSFSYKSAIAWIVSGFVVLVQILLILSLFICDFYVVTAIWIFKIIVELLFFRRIATQQKIQKNIFVEILLGIIYPFFAVLVGVCAIFYSGTTWKGRKIN